MMSSPSEPADKQPLTKEQASRVLGPVSFAEDFHFYWDVGQYTGLSALGLTEFERIVREIGVKSLEFHSSIGDFEKWFASLDDAYLAEKMRHIASSGAKGEELWKQILKAAEERAVQLRAHHSQ